MRATFGMGCLAVLLFTTAAWAQDSSGVRRPVGSQLRPSAGGAPAAATTSPKPSASSPATRPNASAFARPAAAPVEDATASDAEATRPASNFGGRSSFGSPPPTQSGSRFQPVNGSEHFQEGSSDDAPTSDAVGQPSTNFSFPTRSTPAARSAPPATSSPATAPRTFGAAPGAATTGGTTPTPRNPLPARTSPASRIASSAAAPLNSTPPATTDAASPVAEAYLKQSLEPRAEHALPGQPVSLGQVVQQGGSAGQRIRAVQAYWKLVSRVAAYHTAADDRRLFAQLNGRQLSAHERAALAAAQLSAEAALERAELDFVTTQHELAEAARLGDVEAQSLPSDLPLVSEYRTHFTTLYGSGGAPSGLRRLDRALPYHLKNVRSQADATIAAQQAFQSAVEAVSSGEASVSSLLEIHRHYVRQREAFGKAVYDYNALIAEYALNVAPNQSPGTIVGMLIKTRPATRSAAVIDQDQVVRTVGAEAPLAADHAPVLPSADEGATLAPAQPQDFPSRQPVRFRMEESESPAEVMEDQAEPELEPSRLSPRN